jgi:hypothetical protein
LLESLSYAVLHVQLETGMPPTNQALTISQAQKIKKKEGK